ncbi:MAG: hypothetical protein HOD63_06500 [Bacteroidetes bacterium]|nr:hypothetical protein [Bacteroidota bacterium]
MKQLLKVFVAIIFVIGMSHNVHSQDKEVGVYLGVTEYLGDLTWKHVSWNQSKLGGGAFFRYYFTPRFNFKGGLYYGKIEGYDGDKDPAQVGAAWSREGQFYSHLLDFHGQIEYNILPFISGNKLRNWSPYIFTGVSVFNFNPKGVLNGTVYELQPLGTEGQGKPGYEAKYALTQISIPYGFGVKYSFKRPRSSKQLNLYLWNIALYVSQNKTFTDHLDDFGGEWPDYTDFNMADPNDAAAVQLSDRLGTIAGGVFTSSCPNAANEAFPRGNPEANDAYMWFGFSISKTFRKNTCFWF